MSILCEKYGVLVWQITTSCGHIQTKYTGQHTKRICNQNS